jgi:hypothetical protein
LSNPTACNALPVQVINNDDVVDIIVVGISYDFGWKGSTLMDLENENKAAFDKLDSSGIHSKLLHLRLNSMDPQLQLVLLPLVLIRFL